MHPAFSPSPHFPTVRTLSLTPPACAPTDRQGTEDFDAEELEALEEENQAEEELFDQVWGGGERQRGGGEGETVEGASWCPYLP